LDTKLHAQKSINSPTILQSIKFCIEEILKELKLINKNIWLECVEIKLKNQKLFGKMIEDQKQLYREKIVEYFLNKNGEVDEEDFDHLTNKIKEIDGN